MTPYLIYDLEIKKAILGKNEEKKEGIQYCKGWGDHAGMCISCLCCYDYGIGVYRVFTDSNKNEFAELTRERTLVGFNNHGFDEKVLLACWRITLLATMDILVGIKNTTGTHAGFGLDKCCEANFGVKKSGSGAMAPVEWQLGNIGHVIDYCINDVYMTKRLFDMIRTVGGIRSPRNPKEFIPVSIQQMGF